MTTVKKLVVVIGAGVTGLQTSVSLLQAGYRVAIIGKHFPGDKSIEYTSPWAGGHWRSHAGIADAEQQEWDTQTYQHWLNEIKQEQNEAGLRILSGLALRRSRYYSESSKAPWYSSIVLDYEQTPKESLGPGIQHGHTYTSVMVNVPMYLHYLREKARSLGAVEIQEELPCGSNFSETLHAAAQRLRAHFGKLGLAEKSQVSAFVNATGLLASKLVPDPDVYPVRGQTLTVAGEAKQITTIEAYASEDNSGTPIVYILPRPHSNTTVLGGTKEAGNWSAEPDPMATKEIIRRAKEWAPELLNDQGEFEILSVQVGLRPARKGGVRVEIEKVDDFLICHAYGHAGAGYQNSVGSANKVLRLLEAQLGFT
ncbi:FAD dependent oxidoreductase [Glonium stellatum]|uniref:FAD dependent oxidoreductase n=1 Tax=Glonium stellatum TaxID=574774 RepID=A0A8E2F052_9PEZI|nr:FAD dependent oxidoreductase [Glonium stellatum]